MAKGKRKREATPTPAPSSTGRRGLKELKQSPMYDVYEFDAARMVPDVMADQTRNRYRHLAFHEAFEPSETWDNRYDPETAMVRTDSAKRRMLQQPPPEQGPWSRLWNGKHTLSDRQSTNEALMNVWNWHTQTFGPRAAAMSRFWDEDTTNQAYLHHAAHSARVADKQQQFLDKNLSIVPSLVRMIEHNADRGTLVQDIAPIGKQTRVRHTAPRNKKATAKKKRKRTQ